MTIAWESIHDGYYDDSTDCTVCGSAVDRPTDDLCRACLRDRSIRAGLASGEAFPVRTVEDEDADREADRYEQQLYGHHNHEGAA